jgi:hypothetical protein
VRDDAGAPPEGYWFTSSKFEIEPGEDEEINPHIYGRQLAGWLAGRLRERGYPVEIVPEDWGRCLMCGRDPFLLWVGCASVTGGAAPEGGEDASDTPPPAETIVWHCFVAAEVFFWKRLFRKIDTAPAVARLDRDLGEILRAEPSITLVSEP